MRWALPLVGLGLGATLAARWSRRYPLRDRVALVTGGSRGLGLQLARELLHRGARVAICGRDADTLARAREALAANGTVETVVADLTDPDALPGLVQAVRERLGPIDVLVNNAGVIQVAPFEAVTWDDVHRGMQLHCFTPLRLVELALPDLEARGGVVVNVTSIGGRVAVPRLLPYSASKHAQIGLSHALRVELARRGVRVLTVVPGLMNTGGFHHATFKGRHTEEFRWFALADTLPVLAISAERAARRIVNAVQSGRAELFVGSPPSRLVVWAERLAPGATYAAASAIDRWLLPEPAPDLEPRSGKESAGPLERRWAPRRARRALEQLNQESS